MTQNSGSTGDTTPMPEPLNGAATAATRTPQQLAAIVEAIASRPEQWIGRVRLRSHGRWYERLHHGQDHDVWLISWLPGQSTGLHDHGESSGAFVVAVGVLEEQRPGDAEWTLLGGGSHAFGPDYVHDVRNASPAPAISIHAYSPPLTEMNEYELDGTRRTAGPADPQSGVETDGIPGRPNLQRVDQLLAAARARLQRLSAADAYAAVAKEGAVLVDIRPAAQRGIEGSIAGAMVVERNVLEWRFDPTSTSRLPVASSHDLPVIIFCSEGYTSSLAAAALQEIGLWRATDVVGGFKAWRSQGLPTLPPDSSE